MPTMPPLRYPLEEGSTVQVRYPDHDDQPRDEWPWLAGVIDTKVVQHHEAGCLSDPDWCRCPALEYGVVVLSDEHAVYEVGDDEGRFPFVYRALDELRHR